MGEGRDDGAEGPMIEGHENEAGGMAAEGCGDEGEEMMVEGHGNEAGGPVEENLPNAELEVLASLWQQGKATARGIREAMADFRPMSHGSMVSLLNRLEAKGLVTKKKGPVGKAFVYRPTQRPEPTYRRIMRDLNERVFGGSGVAMVASLFESRPPSRQELDELEELLQELREKRAGEE